VQREAFLEKLASLRMAPRGGGERYPHKPLLLLWLLGRMQQQGNSACTYEEAEKPVSRLLDDFGPPSANRYRAAMPFVHLESDLWELSGDEGEPLGDNRAALCRAHAKGRLREEVEELLRKDPSLIAESARRLIDLNFTPTYLDPICDEVGLNLEAAEEAGWQPWKPTRARRRPGFRSEVLRGWRNRCAMCGYDGVLDRDPAGLDAAHVLWHSHGWPRRRGQRVGAVLAAPRVVRLGCNRPQRRPLGQSLTALRRPERARGEACLPPRRPAAA